MISNIAIYLMLSLTNPLCIKAVFAWSLWLHWIGSKSDLDGPFHVAAESLSTHNKTFTLTPGKWVKEEKKKLTVSNVCIS